MGRLIFHHGICWIKSRRSTGHIGAEEQAMLWDASAINGYAIEASDGRLGSVSDLLFEDANWIIRWLVVDTGNWLSGRRVLLPLATLGHPDPALHEFSVKFTMQQVKESPDVDTDQPVSRQNQTYLYNHYGFYPYPNEEDSHLRSIATVTGYHIHAADGEIGHVEDFLVDDASWGIRYITVNTRNWWPGERVLISPRSVWEIDWADRFNSMSIVKGSKMVPYWNQPSQWIEPMRKSTAHTMTMVCLER
jgi:hypothetical protein